jgi:hypothetical protein
MDADPNIKGLLLPSGQKGNGAGYSLTYGFIG